MVDRPQRTRLAAYGLALSADRVLLVRASERSRAPGTWWLPGGGVDFGESPAEAVVREFLEETGLHVRVAELLDVTSSLEEHLDEHLHTVRAIYAVGVEHGDLRPEADGSSDTVQWIPTSQAPSLPVMPFFTAYIPAPADR